MTQAQFDCLDLLLPDAPDDLVDQARRWVTYLRLVADSSRTADSPRVEFAIAHARQELRAHELERLRAAWVDVIRSHAQVALGGDVFFDLGAPQLELDEALDRIGEARGVELELPAGPAPGEGPADVADRWLEAFVGCEPLWSHFGSEERAYWNAARGRFTRSGPSGGPRGAGGSDRGARSRAGTSAVRSAARGFASLFDRAAARGPKASSEQSTHRVWRLAALRRELECHLDAADWESVAERFRRLGEGERRDPRVRILASWAFLARSDFERARGLQGGLQHPSDLRGEPATTWRRAPIRLGELAADRPEWRALLLGPPGGLVEPGEDGSARGGDGIFGCDVQGSSVARRSDGANADRDVGRGAGGRGKLQTANPRAGAGHLVVLEGSPGTPSGDQSGGARNRPGVPEFGFDSDPLGEDLGGLRAHWGASFLGVVLFRVGIGRTLVASDAAPGLRGRVDPWFEAREGSWTQTHEPECRLVRECETLVEHRTSDRIRGAIDPDHTRAVALIPIFDRSGEVGGWVWAEWSHHLIPARVRLERGAGAWTNRIRLEGERAAESESRRLSETARGLSGGGAPEMGGSGSSGGRTQGRLRVGSGAEDARGYSGAMPSPTESSDGRGTPTESDSEAVAGQGTGRPGIPKGEDVREESKATPRARRGGGRSRCPRSGSPLGAEAESTSLDGIRGEAPFRVDPGNEGRWTLGDGEGVPVGEEGDVPRKGSRADIALGDRVALRASMDQFHRWIEALAIKTHQRRWWGVLPGPRGPVLLVEGGGALRPRAGAWGHGRGLHRCWASGEPVSFEEPDSLLSIHPDAASGIVLPLHARGRVVALLALESTRRRDFRPKDVERMAARLAELAPGFHVARFSDWHEARFRDPIHFAEGTGGLVSRLADILAAGQSRGPIVLRGEPGVGRHTVARWLHFESGGREGPCVRIPCKRIARGSAPYPWTVEGWQAGSWWKRRLQTVDEYGLDPGGIDWRGTLVLDQFESLPQGVRDDLEEWLEVWSKLPAEDPILAAAPRLVVLTRPDVDCGLVPTGGPRRAPAESSCARGDSTSVGYGLATTGDERVPSSNDRGGSLERFRIDVPRLRERREEIPTLAALLAQRYASEEGLPRMRFHAEALATLWRQDWEGNLPELGSLVYKLALLHPGKEIGAGEVADVARRFGLKLVTRLSSKNPVRADVIAALESTRTGRGTLNKTRASLYLGWDPDTLVARMRDLKLDLGTGAELVEDSSDSPGPGVRPEA